ncbi:hypothetical protein [Aneurinibacillus tyrosinisolvens]|uniref:hypothetical protein n=1 Tax=Aneurinibacillus tyrosinisolvens TaxID=1443435 RepID=UPI00069B599E|nr:hypothetical protein [Aneurinibacillus tyrosinisolvens]
MEINEVLSENQIGSPKEKYQEVNEPQTKPYLEILGDTVVPSNILYSVLLSIFFSLGGYFLGKNIFPLLADKKMVPSYSLLLGIAGSLMALVICSRLFKPSRILNESETTIEGMHEVLKDLQLDPQKEYEIIKNDPVTRKEMEELGLIDKLERSGG